MKRNLAIKELSLKEFDKPVTELKSSTLYKLLVCVMFSAQCTDKRVNLITPALSKAYPGVKSLTRTSLANVRSYIQSCSFFNNKVQNLIKMAQAVCEHFNSEIPLNGKDLRSLAGVGQKTAHVVLIEWCRANFMAMDTHVFRASHRSGLSKAKTPEATEKDLTRIFKDELNYLHQAMVLSGRYTCKAKDPLCHQCFLYDFCKSKDKELKEEV